jgi:hypothetical protein
MTTPTASSGMGLVGLERHVSTVVVCVSVECRKPFHLHDVLHDTRMILMTIGIRFGEQLHTRILTGDDYAPPETRCSICVTGHITSASALA